MQSRLLRLSLCALYLLYTLHYVQVCAAREYRLQDGSGNNVKVPCLGKFNQPLRRLFPAYYANNDGHSMRQFMTSNRTVALPGPRLISNTMFARQKTLNTRRMTADLHTFFAMLINVDTTNTAKGGGPPGPSMAVPKGDPWFDPHKYGNVSLPFSRAGFVWSGNSSMARAHYNGATPWLDLDCIYGHVHEAPPQGAQTIRVFQRGYIWLNHTYNFPAHFVPNQGPFRPAGDARINKTPPVTALDHLFRMEHNRLCDELYAANPTWNDEMLFQEARRWNIAFFSENCHTRVSGNGCRHSFTAVPWLQFVRQPTSHLRVDHGGFSLCAHRDQ